MSNQTPTLAELRAEFQDRAQGVGRHASTAPWLVALSAILLLTPGQAAGQYKPFGYCKTDLGVGTSNASIPIVFSGPLHFTAGLGEDGREIQSMSGAQDVMRQRFVATMEQRYGRRGYDWCGNGYESLSEARAAISADSAQAVNARRPRPVEMTNWTYTIRPSSPTVTQGASGSASTPIAEGDAGPSTRSRNSADGAAAASGGARQPDAQSRRVARRRASWTRSSSGAGSRS
jgi:hypothetical protein